MKRISAMQHLVILILIAGLSGCSLLSDGFDEITVTNTTEKPLYFYGVEKEFSHRLYINPKIPTDKIVSVEDFHFLKARTSNTLQKEDVAGEYDAGKTLRLFLYEVRGDTAYSTSFLDFTYDQLEQEDFRIEVTEFQ